jgi:quercetin dioxygenase-like cupin family protein
MASIMSEIKFDELDSGLQKLRDIARGNVYKREDLLELHGDMALWTKQGQNTIIHGLWRVKNSAGFLAISEKNSVIRPHTNEGVKVICTIVEGESNISVDNQITNLKKGSVIVLDENVVHSWCFKEKTWVMCIALPSNNLHPLGIDSINALFL